MTIGKFVVSPLTHPTDSGAFSGSVTVSSGQGSGSSHRVTRFHRPYALPEAAQLVALTQGWLQACSPRFPSC